MTTEQYKNIQIASREYYNSLNVEDVKKEFLSSSLLNQNKKLSKGDLVNYGLELTPSKLVSSFNMCGGEGHCLFTCLVFSGVDNMLKSKSWLLSNTLKMRIRRTFLFLNAKEFFIEKLESEIKLLSNVYKNIAIRLNVFSDLEWALYLEFNNMPSNVIFYDYTKKLQNTKNEKIHFTYSASEKDSDQDLMEMLSKGFNVAMVFKVVPETWNNFEVIDGDLDDNRYNDKKGVVVGLKQKTTMGGKTKTVFTSR